MRKRKIMNNRLAPGSTIQLVSNAIAGEAISCLTMSLRNDKKQPDANRTFSMAIAKYTRLCYYMYSCSLGHYIRFIVNHVNQVLDDPDSN